MLADMAGNAGAFPFGSAAMGGAPGGVYDPRSGMRIPTPRPASEVHNGFPPERLGSGQSSTPIEQDPSGLSSKDPGSKLDAGKLDMGLMISGFTPALAALGRYTDDYDSPLSVETYPDAVAAASCVLAWPKAIAAVAEVTNIGAKKYTEGGWAQVQNGERRYYAALLRHFAKSEEEEYDADTGCLHLAQCAWNALAAACLARHDNVDTSPYLQLALFFLDAVENKLDGLN